jgi:hypothetical protein
MGFGVGRTPPSCGQNGGHDPWNWRIYGSNSFKAVTQWHGQTAKAWRASLVCGQKMWRVTCWENVLDATRNVWGNPLRNGRPTCLMSRRRWHRACNLFDGTPKAPMLINLVVRGSACLLRMACFMKLLLMAWETFPIDVPPLAACSGPVHRPTKLHWRWCFFGSGNSWGSASLSMFLLAVLGFGGGR